MKPTKCQRPLTDRKTNFGLIIYSHNPNNPENLAKIGPVDFEIIGLTGIDKTRQINKKQKQNMKHGVPPYSSQAG